MKSLRLKTISRPSVSQALLQGLRAELRDAKVQLETSQQEVKSTISERVSASMI